MKIRTPLSRNHLMQKMTRGVGLGGSAALILAIIMAVPTPAVAAKHKIKGNALHSQNGLQQNSTSDANASGSRTAGLGGNPSNTTGSGSRTTGLGGNPSNITGSGSRTTGLGGDPSITK
jgi:hypothetical protein